VVHPYAAEQRKNPVEENPLPETVPFYYEGEDGSAGTPSIYRVQEAAILKGGFGGEKKDLYETLQRRNQGIPDKKGGGGKI